MSDYDVLRVFCGPDGSGGNELGIVLDGAAIPTDVERLALAKQLKFSETVFVDDPRRGVIDIYTPSTRLPFAGHPCVGAAWLLGVPRLVTRAGTVSVRQDEAGGSVRARAFPGRGDGIDEDEATGAAALLLTHSLGRDLTITQGRGSQIVTIARPDGLIEVGGRVRR